MHIVVFYSHALVIFNQKTPTSPSSQNDICSLLYECASTGFDYILHNIANWDSDVWPFSWPRPNS